MIPKYYICTVVSCVKTSLIEPMLMSFLYLVALEQWRENLIQHSNAFSAYDIAWHIGAYHHAIGNKLHNPCNNSCPNERA